MRIPLPKNKLVALSLVGGILSLAAAAALATPAMWSASADPVAAQAPPDDPSFVPAVSSFAHYEDDDDDDEREHRLAEWWTHEADEADEH